MCIRVVAFLPLTKCNRLRHSSLIMSSYLHVTLHVIKPELCLFTSNCSKPNSSASPFKEAQLENTKLRSTITKLRSNGTSLLSKCSVRFSRASQSRWAWSLWIKDSRTQSQPRLPPIMLRKIFRRSWSSAGIRFSRVKAVVQNSQANEKAS